MKNKFREMRGDLTQKQMGFEQLAHEYDLLLADYHRLCRVHDADLEETRTLKDQLNFYRAQQESKRVEKNEN